MWQVLVLVLRDVSTVVGFGWVGAESSEAPSQRYEELETWYPQSDHATLEENVMAHGPMCGIMPVGTALGMYVF